MEIVLTKTGIARTEVRDANIRNKIGKRISDNKSQNQKISSDF